MSPGALANHSGAGDLEVTPEATAVPYLTDEATVTAVIGQPAGPGGVNIDFENESDRAPEGDGLTPLSPDYTCTIEPNAKTCSVTILRTVGKDYIRSWIDRDGINGTRDDDQEERRLATTGSGGTDCTEASDTSSMCTPVPVNDPVNDVAITPGSGTGCDTTGFDLPDPESDCTDVFRIDWTGPPNIPVSVDCDDAGGPDTEREPGSVGQTKTYTCKVLNASNVSLARDVWGEVENGINDPDPADGTSYHEPDFRCVATEGGCQVTITQSEGELGTMEICWWVVQDGETGAGVGGSAGKCGNEPTDESSNADGSDFPNDLADQVELTWFDPLALRNDCDPETNTDPVGSPHKITCTLRNSSGVPQSGVNLDVEASGTNAPADNPPPLSNAVDFTCTTDADGKCSFIHGPGGVGSTSTTGSTTYQVWVDADNNDTTVEADATEGQNDQVTPGTTNEPDGTDVVFEEWIKAPNAITLSPETDMGEVGTCIPIEIMAKNGAAVISGATIDLEQIHDKTKGSEALDEPTVEFCTPTEGQNISTVDTTSGDMGPSSSSEEKETPDNKGTAGGETSKETNLEGKVTVGLKVTPGQGSDGSGSVQLMAWYDPDDDDDPDDAEPKRAAAITWVLNAPAGGRAIECEPTTADLDVSEDHTIDCLVISVDGNPQVGQAVNWSESGAGGFTATQTVTDEDGHVQARLESGEDGEQTVEATLTNSLQGEPDIDDCDRSIEDPTGAPAGKCSDAVTVTWSGAVPPQCSDGIDNEGDGTIDLDDAGCSSAEDDDESDEPEPVTCPGYEGDSRNQVVGSEGNDVLTGTEEADIICGLGGDDLIDGLGGDDLILGGDGNDNLRGQDGNDSLKGGSGNDSLEGGRGKDIYSGGSGRDDCGYRRKEKAKGC